MNNNSILSFLIIVVDNHKVNDSFVIMKLSVGNKVKFLNEKLEGKIIAIISKECVLVSCSDGFEHEVALNELIIIDKDNQHLYKIDDIRIADKITSKKKKAVSLGILSRYLSSSKYKLENVLEIDLHLEELVEFPEKLDDWQKLHTQITHVKNCLESAFHKNIKRIVFIHGVGTGVLKTEIHNYLANYDNLTIKDADYKEYGSGATDVIIKN